MVVATKFRFESRLCEGKVLAPLTSVVLNGNYLVSFTNIVLDLVYLFSYDYYKFEKKKRTKNKFLVMVLDKIVSLSHTYT